MRDKSEHMPITEQPLPYVGCLDARPLSQIDLVVMHCTELPDMAMAREYGERVLYPSGTGHSGHFYIDRDGSIIRYVPMDRIANHTRGFNPRSIGIEIVNIGRYPHWLDSRHQAMNEPYTAEQQKAVISLLAQLKAELPNLTFIAGHEDLDTEKVPASDNPNALVYRKRDPGPHFHWPEVLATCGLSRLFLESHV
jgi:N-acetylmuramoyl-L-alanine amidase